MERKAHGLWNEADLDADLSFITNLLWDPGQVASPVSVSVFCVYKNATIEHLPLRVLVTIRADDVHKASGS